MTGRLSLQMRSNLSPVVDDEAGRFRAALPDLREPVGPLRVSPATYGVVESTVALAAAARLGVRAPAPTSAQ